MIRDKLIRIKRSRYKPEELFLIDILNDIELKEQYEYPDSVFWVVGDVIMFEQDFKHKRLFVNDGYIWSVFETKYGYKYTKIESIITDVVGKYLNLKDLIPTFDVFLQTKLYVKKQTN